ncbi:hypothetical protein JHK84_035226 [Glycine max]|nr:hypothetical protein JHK85_051211 [Glycine max]KAG5128829.1 hypothetical protein JHK84_035226 [Glycine max]
MDPATAERLSQIDQEIQNIDTEKAQRQQTLAAFWEHLPPIDPALVAAAMQRILDRIRGLEERRRALLQEQRDLIGEYPRECWQMRFSLVTDAFSDMSRMSSSFLSQGELVIGQAVTSYLSHMRSRKESSTDSPRMDLARKRNKAIGAIADSSDREFSNSLPSNLFGQRKLKTPSTGKTDYLILVNVTSAEVTSISTIGRGLKVGKKIGLSLELRTSSSLSERSVQ